MAAGCIRYEDKLLTEFRQQLTSNGQTSVVIRHYYVNIAETSLTCIHCNMQQRLVSVTQSTHGTEESSYICCVKTENSTLFLPLVGLVLCIELKVVRLYPDVNRR
jgi:hypothetical protein